MPETGDRPRAEAEGAQASRLAAFLAELRRRRVFRALLAWGIVSFAVLQVVEPVMHGLDLPDWTLRAAVWALAAGFPVTSALAWLFDLGPGGVTRTVERPVAGAAGSAHPRLAMALAGLVAASALLGAGVAALALGRVARQPLADPDGRISVAVADFANETRDPDLDGLSGLLITSLEQSRRLKVMTRGRMLDLLRQAGKGDAARIDENLARDAGRKAGVRALLVASVRKLGETYAAELRALDPERDEYLFTLREQAAAKGELLPLIDRLSDGVRARLRESEAEVKASEVNVAEAVTPSLEAYRHYFRGKEALARLDVGSALAECARAVEIEPRFALAHFEIAFWGLLSGSRDRRHIDVAVGSAARAPEKERGLIQALDDVLRGRFASGRTRLRAVAARFPDDAHVSLEVAELFGFVGDIDAQIEGLERALRVHPEQHLFRMELVSSLEFVGRGAETLRAAEEAARSAPTPEARTPLALAKAQLGDLDGAIADLESAVAAQKAAGRADEWSLWLLAQALAAVGRGAEAEGLLAGRQGHLFDLARAVAAAYGGRLAAGRAHLLAGSRSPEADAEQWRAHRAWYLAAAGRRDEARRLAGAVVIPYYDLVLHYETGDDRRVREILEELPPEGIAARLFRALLLHRAGRTDEARAALRVLGGRSGWYVPYYQGALAAESGHDQEAVEALQRFAQLLYTADSLIHPWLHARARFLLARSLDRLGRRAEARSVLEKQLALWRDADADLPLLAEMKALHRQLGRGR